jgi:hypothetical protein
VLIPAQAAHHNEMMSPPLESAAFARRTPEADIAPLRSINLSS